MRRRRLVHHQSSQDDLPHSELLTGKVSSGPNDLLVGCGENTEDVTGANNNHFAAKEERRTRIEGKSYFVGLVWGISLAGG